MAPDNRAPQWASRVLQDAHCWAHRVNDGRHLRGIVMRRTHGYLSLLLVSATLGVAGCGAWSSGAEPVPSAPHEFNEGSPSALSGEQSAAASELTNELGEDPRFGSVALNAATGGLVLYWHGDPPDQVLASVRDSHPEVPVEVRGVEPVSYTHLRAHET